MASHCTNSDGDIGGVDDANIYQPSRNLIVNNKVAKEEIDPSLHHINDWDCPTNYQCRYSDAAFAEMESGVSMDLGEIAKPEGVREIDVDPAGTTFDITGEASSLKPGDDVYYIGATRGWRTAEVSDDCTYYTVKYRERIICVGAAIIGDGGPSPASGDSGGPVLAPDGGDDVELLGTIFARSGSTVFYFSRIGYIYLELGSSATWDVCTSGC